MENLYRIHDNVLLSLEYNTRIIRPVYKYAKDNIIQYVDKIEEELFNDRSCRRVIGWGSIYFL